MPRLLYDIDDVDQRTDRVIERAAPWVLRTLGRYFDYRLDGAARIPDGPALYVANHNAAMLSHDTYLFGATICQERGVDFVPYGLGHEVALSAPIINHVMVPLGAVRAGHANAAQLFDRGRKVLVYPGGDVDDNRPWSRRNEIVFDGRRGFARLAIRHGVPIVPVVSAGAHEAVFIADDGRWLAKALGVDRRLRMKVWPIAIGLPFGLYVGPLLFICPWPSPIRAEVLPPITFPRTGPEAAKDEPYVWACAAEVQAKMQAALTRLAEERRVGIVRGHAAARGGRDTDRGERL